MPSAKPRAFVSYGWQDNAELVQRLKAELQADGWEVWFDKDRITGRDAFAAEIEDGIRWCDLWAAQRMSQSWTLGPARDDAAKKHPCLVPNGALPESENEFDR